MITHTDSCIYLCVQELKLIRSFLFRSPMQKYVLFSNEQNFLIKFRPKHHRDFSRNRYSVIPLYQKKGSTREWVDPFSLDNIKCL